MYKADGSSANRNIVSATLLHLHGRVKPKQEQIKRAQPWAVLKYQALEMPQETSPKSTPRECNFFLFPNVITTRHVCFTQHLFTIYAL